MTSTDTLEPAPVYMGDNTDCFRACVATVLGCSLEEVPDDPGFAPLWQAWAQENGLELHHSTRLAPIHLPRWIATVKVAPGCTCAEPIAYEHPGYGEMMCRICGQLTEGALHAVVFRYDRLFHDPDPDAWARVPQQDFTLADVIDATAFLPAGVEHFGDVSPVRLTGGKVSTCVSCGRVSLSELRHECVEFLDLQGAAERLAVEASMIGEFVRAGRLSYAREGLFRREDVDAAPLTLPRAYPKIRTPLRLGTPSVFSASDGFDQSAGNATGKAAAVGGTYAALALSDTTDFTINATDHLLERSATLDTGTLASSTREGRAIGLNLNLSATAARLDLLTPLGDHVGGLLVRLVDQNNFFYALVGQNQVTIGKVIGGSDVPLDVAEFPSATEVTLAAVAIGSAWTVYTGRPGGPLSWLAGDSDDDLGATLATGDVYIYDENASAAPETRQYDNFAAWVPEAQHVINSGKSFKLYHDRARTEPVSGTNWGRRTVEGKHLLLPPGGREGLSVRVVVSHHPLDVDELPATDVTNALRADLEVTPRVLLTGRS
jgi:hypothetical protein